MIVRINIELRSILKIVLVLLFGIVCLFLNNNDVKALSSNIELDEQKKVIEETTRIFGNIDIESISYLYNLNDSPDYVFVDFKYYLGERKQLPSASVINFINLSVSVIPS